MPDDVDYNDAVDMLNSGAYELVVYNSCYGGGPTLSEGGEQLFKTLQCNQPDTSTDLLKLKVVNELGVEAASGRCSRFSFALIRKGLGKYVDLNEYDGFEDPSINLSQMVMEELDKVLEANGVLTKEEYNAIKSRDVGLTPHANDINTIPLFLIFVDQRETKTVNHLPSVVDCLDEIPDFVENNSRPFLTSVEVTVDKSYLTVLGRQG